MSVPAGDSTVTLTTTATAAQIKLWWPSGLGAQPLYNLTSTFTPSSAGTGNSAGDGAAAVSTTRQVGFRFFALVTGNDLDAEWVKNNVSLCRLNLSFVQRVACAVCSLDSIRFDSNTFPLSKCHGIEMCCALQSLMC